MLDANPGKRLHITVRGKTYCRYPIKTSIITPEDNDIAGTISKYARSLVKKGDIVFISEKIVAISQGRAYPVNSIRPSKLATYLSGFVTKNPAGIGLSIPETMQLALEEVGPVRLLIAAAVSAFTKPFGIKGIFYRIAGMQAAAIDGPVPYAIPPYNTYASKGPLKAEEVAGKISEILGGVPVCIVDANDLGVELLGSSDRLVSSQFIKEVLRDNPLGQSDESTPIGIIRETEKKIPDYSKF